MFRHFPVAVPAFWADYPKHGESILFPCRNPVAADGRNLAPPPGPDARSPEPKPKGVTHFFGNLNSE